MTTTMGIPPIEYRQCDEEPSTTEKKFQAMQSITEGVAGCLKIDTMYENTERDEVQATRGDMVGRPMPRDDFKDLSANNHGEWLGNPPPGYEGEGSVDRIDPKYKGS